MAAKKNAQDIQTLSQEEARKFLSNIAYYWDKIKERAATIDSPEFIGEPMAPTPSISDSSNKLATTQFVQMLVNNVYEVIDESKDLNDFTEFARLHTAVGVVNAPTDDSEFFIDVDINSDDNTVRQCATAVTADTEDTASEYVRWGSKAEDGEMTWGEWKASGGGSDIQEITEEELDEIFNRVFG